MGESFVDKHHKDFLALEGKKYDPGQPRVPAGSSEGGRWTSGGGASGDFSGGGYKPLGFSGDSNQSQTGWMRGEGKDRQAVGVHYIYEPGPSYGNRPNRSGYYVQHGKPYESLHWVTSWGDVDWDFNSQSPKFKSPEGAVAYLKKTYGIDWDGEFGYSRPGSSGESPSRRMSREQIAQAVSRGELTPQQAARIKF